MLFNFGNLDELQQTPSLKSVATKLLELAGAQATLNKLDINSEAEIFNWGYLVYQNLWNKFELDRILGKIQNQDGKSTFDFNQACFLMAIQHLLASGSKLNAILNFFNALILNA